MFNPATWKDGILLIADILVFAALLGSNIYILVGPPDIYNNMKETYFTPAPWAFLIWPLIHFLHFGALVYQWHPVGKTVIIDAISWLFPLLGILNTMYFYFWAIHDDIRTFIFALLVNFITAYIYYIIKTQHSPLEIGDVHFVQLLFALYQGWATFLTALSLFEAFGVDASTTPAGVWTILSIYIAFCFLQMTAYAYTREEGDFFASLPVAWTLSAIYTHQTSNKTVHWMLFAFSTIGLFRVVWSWYFLEKRIRGRGVTRLDERAPLF